jgi:uncharacterized membrane protein YgcG
MFEDDRHAAGLVAARPHPRRHAHRAPHSKRLRGRQRLRSRRGGSRGGGSSCGGGSGSAFFFFFFF